jgi:hypothetical protein
LQDLTIIKINPVQIHIINITISRKYQVCYKKVKKNENEKNGSAVKEICTAHTVAHGFTKFPQKYRDVL